MPCSADHSGYQKNAYEASHSNPSPPQRPGPPMLNWLQNGRTRFLGFVRMLGSAVVAQALLSAANLSVGLILIRRTTDHEYGSYVLVLNALLLITQIQTQFITPAMVMQMSGAGPAERSSLIGLLYRWQRRLAPIAGAAAVATALGLWWLHVLNAATTALVTAAVAASLATLHREFFRMVLLAYRRPVDVLKSDALYVVLLVSGAMAATLTRTPALTAVVLLCFAAMVGGALLSRALQRHEPWDDNGRAGLMREIAAVGAWTTTSSAIHWTFTQGFNYLVVATLNVKAVAAVAATRLLLMPVNVLSTGVGSLMLPTTSGWLHQQRGPRLIFVRLLLLSVGVACLAGVYFTCLWWLRDWVFSHLLKKDFEHRDLLIALWFVIFVLMVFRDQLLFLPLARGRYRVLTGLTLASAIISLTVGHAAILRIGVAGSLVGVMVGEIISVVGLVILSTLEVRRAARELVPA